MTILLHIHTHTHIIIMWHTYIFSVDWKVLYLILKELPQVMQNRALVLSRHSNDIDFFAAALCSMVS